jgi:hypothetical protein
MLKDDRVITIPNPHRHEVGVDLLARILRQAGIGRKEWPGGQEDGKCRKTAVRYMTPQIAVSWPGIGPDQTVMTVIAPRL